MAIITVSRGSYSMGREVAEKVAQRLGYAVISRDLLLEASDFFQIPEVKLVRAIHDAPSILDRFNHGRQRYIAYFQSALTDRVAADNVVYHGLAGHLLLRGVPHVIKVRIIANMEDRIKAEMERENISYNKARDLLQADDNERRKWTQTLYGVDPWDASLYDLVLHIDKLTADDAAELISRSADMECFQTTAEAQRRMDDLAMACRIKALLAMDEVFDVAVASEYGNVIVYTKLGDRRAGRLGELLPGLVQGVKGLNHIELREGAPFPPEAV